MNPISTYEGDLSKTINESEREKRKRNLPKYSTVVCMRIGRKENKKGNATALLDLCVPPLPPVHACLPKGASS